MVDNFDASKPIYKQIADQFYWKIIRGDLQAGDKLPSVRDTAVAFRVNPNTVSRTYNEMERANVVETKRGLGTFVTEKQDVLNDLKGKKMRQQIEQFVTEMEAMGYTAAEMVNGLKNHLGKERGEND
ncbi:GntR family transcriptional regulator [Bacillus piscicola]|uniref:GntR family transcriptional regulator n=1 Tax=Bacillus piscicola TaxID=1632684 RepID=UPI001F09BD1C|nr:GntR family transcriptional regulator [Bacillus piscicola]